MSLLSKLIINILTKAQLNGVSDVTTSKKDLYYGSNDQVYLVPHEQEAPNIDIGTVTSGTSPAVTVSISGDKALLNFVLQKGDNGKNGKDGKDGTNGTNGTNGTSAYEAAQTGGYTGSEADFNSSLATVPSYCPFVYSDSAPSDVKKLWIDTANSNVLKFYNGTKWTPIGSVFS